MAENSSHWSDLVLLHSSLSEAACMTWVRDVDQTEPLRRIGGEAPFRMRSLDELDLEIEALYNAGSEMFLWEPIGAIVVRVSDNWTLLVEPNGWAGTMAAELPEISAGTEAVSIFWNVNADSEIAVVNDGYAIAVISDVIMFAGEGGQAQGTLNDVTGTDPALVKDLVTDLNNLPDLSWKPTALQWVERYTGVRIPDGWLDRPHPGSVFTKHRG